MLTYVFDGQALRRHRKDRALRVEELSSLVGCSVKTLWFYESGRTIPSATMVGRFAAELGCDPGDLFRLHQRVPA